jgi:hypothetical protein
LWVPCSIKTPLTGIDIIIIIVTAQARGILEFFLIVLGMLHPPSNQKNTPKSLLG